MAQFFLSHRAFCTFSPSHHIAQANLLQNYAYFLYDTSLWGQKVDFLPSRKQHIH